MELKSVEGTGSYPDEAGGGVSYTHAGGIDRPLAIWKSNVGTIVTHQNWRGQFARGTFGVGPKAGQRSDCASYPPSNGCIPVPWPGWSTTAWHEGVGSQQTTGYAHYWMGSLATGMRDASGQMYMRNRYYDPQTGQFTQPDPIGLAGGLNSYGFAAGDPVSYSDPYGLSAEERDSDEEKCDPEAEAKNGRLCPIIVKAKSVTRRVVNALWQCKYDAAGILIGALAGGAAKKFAAAAADTRKSGQQPYQLGHSRMGTLPNRGLVQQGVEALHRANAYDVAVSALEMTQIAGTLIGVWDFGNCLVDNY